MYDPTLLQLFYNATLCYLYSGGGGGEDGWREGRREGGREGEREGPTAVPSAVLVLDTTDLNRQSSYCYLEEYFMAGAMRRNIFTLLKNRIE